MAQCDEPVDGCFGKILKIEVNPGIVTGRGASAESGERHLLRLRVCGSGASEIARLLTEGLEDAEFSIPGQIVADIAAAVPVCEAYGSVTLAIEALTIAE